MSIVERSDEEIAALVQQGAAEHFGLLIERYEAKMLRYARRFLFDGDDSKDVVQDVFLKAYMNIQSFDTAQKFSPWLYRIAHNDFVNALRKRSRGPIFAFDLDAFLPHATAPETADGEAQKQEMREMLDEGLGRLDGKYREPLVLFYFEDMDYKEIADILQIPISTVGVRLQRGKVMLKKIIHRDV